MQNQIIGNNQAAVDTVARVAKQCGLHPLILSTSLQGEAREVAKCFGAMAREIVTTGRPIRRPACLIAGGEVTVTVRGRGGGAPGVCPGGSRNRRTAECVDRDTWDGWDGWTD